MSSPTLTPSPCAAATDPSLKSATAATGSVPKSSAVGQGPVCQDQPSDSSFKSNEFTEFEREFKKYTEENLRNQTPGKNYSSEVRDDGDQLQEKVELLASWWLASRRVVICTGAGVSTAAGLPDYRGPHGVWTRKLLGDNVEDELTMLDGAVHLRPTVAHEAVARLHAVGRVAFVATTNVDGLHSRAGLPREAISELHGNLFVEECNSCSCRFEREFPVRTASGLFDHETGRSCDSCGGSLRDNIVNFGNTVEHVPSMESEHDRAWVECMKADLVVVLGSSLSVPTACDLPEECLPPRVEKPSGGRLVIVNLQRTPKDDLASLCIHATCDEVMELLEAIVSDSGSTNFS
eukprot:TRINITY_DN51356_c0_g1_i1.p1 TRINITY_DN51356_c0_g1~~TRINITY_DN51356_c0_g1_i1.p1  ORF type:complete len:349 (-),score=57.22 TRINITY_DN51356_c0_g1_i1:150-1196(-)